MSIGVRACHAVLVRQPPQVAVSKRVVAALEGAQVAYVMLPPGAGVVEDPSAHRVAVHLGAPHRLWEMRDRGQRDGLHRWGDVVVTAAGERARMRWDQPTVFVDIALSAALVEQAREPRARGAPPALTGSFGHRDAALSTLAVSLMRGALGDRKGEGLALESLVAAMCARLASRGDGPRSLSAESRGGVAPARLRRVLDRIHDALEAPHSLAELSALAGTSRFHFSRQFRNATGLSPHAYLIEARVHEAARLLFEGVDVDEVALRVGMNGRAHLARHLSARLGVTPGRLRSRRSAAPPRPNG